MPDTYRVILTTEALADLEAVAGYIHQHSPQNASGVADVIINAIDSLSMMPTRCRQVGKSRMRGSPVHAMVVRPFIIYFRIEERTAAIYVLSVRHGKRRQPRQFE